MIKFPEGDVKVRKTYWGATPGQVEESEYGGKWEYDEKKASNSVTDTSGDLALFYNGRLFDTPCQLVYLFEVTDYQTWSLIGIDYCFIRPPQGTWQTLESLLTEVYGFSLRGVMYKDERIWLTNDGMTSLRIGPKTLEDGSATTCLFVRYNGEGVYEPIIDYYEEAKQELT